MKFLKYVKKFRLPLIIFIISLIIFCINTCFLNKSEFIKEIALAFLLGSVFYWLTVSLPSYRREAIAKNYVLNEYGVIKETMLSDMLNFLGKRVPRQTIKDSIRHYPMISALITEDDECYIRNHIGEKNFVRESLYNLRFLKDLLSPLFTYDFVKDNEELYKKIKSLNIAIDDFHKDFDLYYTDRDTYDFSKRFVNFINEFLLGRSLIQGQIGRDEFIKLLENA